MEEGKKKNTRDFAILVVLLLIFGGPVAMVARSNPAIAYVAIAFAAAGLAWYLYPKVFGKKK